MQRGMAILSGLKAFGSHIISPEEPYPLLLLSFPIYSSPLPQLASLLVTQNSFQLSFSTSLTTWNAQPLKVQIHHQTNFTTSQPVSHLIPLLPPYLLRSAPCVPFLLRLTSCRKHLPPHLPPTTRPPHATHLPHPPHYQHAILLTSLY